MKRMVTLVCLITLIPLFAFASGQSEGASTPTGAAGTATAAMDLSPWTAAKIDWKQFQGRSISVLALPHAYTLGLKPMLPMFEKLTGINVGYEMFGENEMRRKRAIDLAAHSGLYDVVAIGLTYMGQAAAGNWLTDLNPYASNPKVTDPEWYDLNGIGKTFIDMGTRDGKLLALPIGPSAPIFWYRKDLFAKYGIEVPKTYEEVIAMKQKLQKAMDDDGMKNVYAFTTRAHKGAGANTWTTTAEIRAYGGSVLDENYNCALTSPEAERAIEVYTKMITGYGSPPGSTALDFYQIVDMFTSGNLASMIAGVDHIVFVNDPAKSKAADKWAADLIPEGPAGRFTSPWAWMLAVSNYSKEKDAAWMFLQWASSLPTMRALGTSISPSRVALLDDRAFQALNQPGWIEASRWSWTHGTISRFRSGLPEFPQIGEIASVAYSDIFNGAPVHATLVQACKDINKVMDGGPTKQRLGLK